MKESFLVVLTPAVIIFLLVGLAATYGAQGGSEYYDVEHLALNDRIADAEDRLSAAVERESDAVAQRVIDRLPACTEPQLVQLQDVRIVASYSGGHSGGLKYSLLANVEPPDAMVQCSWVGRGGVDLMPGNRSAYVTLTPSGGDSVEVECVGVVDTTGSVRDVWSPR